MLRSRLEALRHRAAYWSAYLNRRRPRMARAKRKSVGAAKTQTDDISLSGADKIARLLAILVVRDLETDDAAPKLHGAGFSAREISDLLDVGSNYLNVAKHRSR